jgi:hypothetical protein
MKKLVLLCLCGLSIPLLAQTKLRTFTSSDGVFQFKYPDLLVDCTSPGKHDNGSAPSVPESCLSQGAVCDGPGSGGSALACFAYPKEIFEHKPYFVTASFFVSEIEAVKTEQQCLKGSPDWFVISSKARTTRINHVSFKTFEIGTTGAVEANRDPYIERFTMERAMNWACRLSFHVQCMIRELSRRSPRTMGPKWRAVCEKP